MAEKVSMMSSLVWLLFHYLTTTLGADTLYNVALYKPAFLSTMYKDWTPEKGNDGDTTVNELGGQCTQTSPLNNSWWMVDLLDTYIIKAVVLTNRNDYLQWAVRLNHFLIDVFINDPRKTSTFPNVLGSICYQQTEAVTIGTFTWNCSKPVAGRYLRLIKYTEDSLNFCELQVWATTPTEASPFKVYKNKKLDVTSLFDLTVSRSMVCASKCLEKRYTDGCAAFNWFPSTRLCQLLNVDPRDVTVVTKLVSMSDVQFYIIKF
ncbi:fucolectin-5-like [Physella acuta]|uniref:fucolectin-5-like n=1 Tax=Physella acuta TaxID=109671 RepID=UPI0027DDB789|nr:fucolectin-5-like [Physella acuta]